MPRSRLTPASLGCIVLFILPFIATGGFTLYLGLTKQTKHGEDALAATLGGAAAVTLAGAALAAVLWSYRAQRIADGLREEYPDRPWRHEPRFDGHVVRAGSPGRVAAGWLCSIFLSLISAAIVTAIALDGGRPIVAMVVASVFVAIAVAALATTVYQTLRALKYGDPELHLSAMPLLPGTRLEGVVLVRHAIDAEANVALDVRCDEVIEHGSGRSRRLERKTLAKVSSTLARTELGSTLEGWTLIPVRIDVPAGPSRTMDTYPEIQWRLDVRASTPGVDFGESFDLPVYAVDAALVEKRPGPLPA